MKKIQFKAILAAGIFIISGSISVLSVSADVENTPSIGYYAADEPIVQATYEYDGLVYSLKMDGTLEVSDCNSDLPDIIIPEKVDGKVVTSIGRNAFSNSFNMISITIPKSVINIAERAFLLCKSLTDIIVSENNTKYKSIDGALLLKDGSKLLRVPVSKGDDYVIPEGVTIIGDSAVAYCNKFISISLPKSVNTIGIGAFRECSNLSNVIISEGVENIGASAFHSTNLQNITIPNSVISVGQAAFANTPLWNSQEGIKYADKWIAGCDENIDNKNVEIKDGTIGISDSAFKNSNLIGINIPDSVIYIKEESFGMCQNLINISVSEGNSYFKSVDGALLSKDGLKLLCVPICKSEYAIPNGVVIIGENALQYCSSLTSIIIPESVSDIEAGAFKHCIGLKSIDIPNEVTSIKSDTFNSCENLSSITLPNSLVSIGKHAFYQCSNLKDITIPDNVESIGIGAFDCCGLKNVNIPKSVTSIDEYAFNCNRLSSITIENDECEIDDSEYTVHSETTMVKIYGYEGSTAQSYAKKYSLKFIVLEPVLIKGDVDNDSTVSINDATIALNIYASQMVGLPIDKYSKAQIAAADVDENNEVSISDATMILNFYAQSIVGLNPSWDSILSTK